MSFSGGEAAGIFGDDTRFSLIPDVVAEIRKRPDRKSANSYVDAIIAAEGVVERERFANLNAGEHFDFLYICASTLSPTARAYLSPTEDRDLNQALQIAANEENFFQASPQFGKAMVSLGLLKEDELEANKSTKRSWFRYPAKRVSKLATGDYLWTDEMLVATAVSTAILLDRPVLVISDDSDLAAIMKQAADNIIWSSCVIDSVVTYGKRVPDRIIQCYGSRCRDLDGYREGACGARLRRIYQSPFEVNPNRPDAGEVCVYRPSTSEVGMYSFSPAVKEFVCNVEMILDDAGLT